MNPYCFAAFVSGESCLLLNHPCYRNKLVAITAASNCKYSTTLPTDTIDPCLMKVVTVSC